MAGTSSILKVNSFRIYFTGMLATKKRLAAMRTSYHLHPPPLLKYKKKKCEHQDWAYFVVTLRAKAWVEKDEKQTGSTVAQGNEEKKML